MRRIWILLLLTAVIGGHAEARKIEDVPVEKLKQRVEKASDTIFVLNFWATWCQPCVKEIPEFNKIPNTYKGKPVKVIMANLDFPNQKDSRVLPFLETNEVKHEVLMTITPRGGEWIEAMDPTWSGAIPATIIMYKGKRFFHEGETKYETIIKWIESLL